MKIVPQNHVDTFCRPGKGADSCRFGGLGPEGFVCFKHDPTVRQTIDRRHKEGSMLARGDNCDGLFDTQSEDPA